MTQEKGLRILMLIAQFHPLIGGTENQALALSKELTAGGDSVDILTLHRRGEPAVENVEGVRILRRIRVLPLGFFWGLTYLFSTALFLLFRVWRYDILHCHQFQTFHLAAAVLFGRLSGRPVIVKIAASGEESDIRILRRHKGGAILSALHGKADRIVCTTEVMRREAVDLGLDPGRIVIIPGGAAPPSPPSGHSFRESFGLPAGTYLLATVSRLVPGKAIDVLLDAFSRLAEGETPVHLAIIGDGTLRPALEARADTLGIGGKTTFCGWVPRAADIMGELDLLVFPSLCEGFPGVIAEAMAAGVPIAASDIPPHREILEGGRLGWLAVAGEDVSLFKVMRGALVEREESARRAERARERARERYSIKAVAETYRTLYTRLLARNGE